MIKHNVFVEALNHTVLNYEKRARYSLLDLKLRNYINHFKNVKTARLTSSIAQRDVATSSSGKEKYKKKKEETFIIIDRVPINNILIYRNETYTHIYVRR